MKNFIALIVLVFFSISVSSQVTDQDLLNNEMMIPVYKKTPQGYTGSPFVNEEFKNGIILDEEGRSQPAFLRYNAVEGIMEIKLNRQEERIHVLPRIKKITYVLDGYTYFIDAKRTEDGELLEGYFVNYYDGEKAKLIGWPRPDLRDAQEAKTGYEKDKPTHLSVNMEYFLEIGDSRLKEVRLRSKDFRNAFDNFNIMKDYLSDNKVRDIYAAIEAVKYFDKQS